MKQGPTFSLVVNHTPWRPERVESLREMLDELRRPPAFSDAWGPGNTPLYLNDADYRGTDWQTSKVQWALDQWTWSAEWNRTHHVFLTDDLHLMPGFWRALSAMVEGCPDNPIGLLSNHPRGPETWSNGHAWYRTNSWLVGPAYVLPHAFLLEFLEYFRALPDGNTAPGMKGWANDDSSINEYVTRSGRWTAHPLPTIIEHRGDLESTVGHGDKYSRERLSWRAIRSVAEEQPGGTFEWVSTICDTDTAALMRPGHWEGAASSPLLTVGE